MIINNKQYVFNLIFIINTLLIITPSTTNTAQLIQEARQTIMRSYDTFASRHLHPTLSSTISPWDWRTIKKQPLSFSTNFLRGSQSITRIDEIKKAELNCYYLPIAWDKVEPQEGVFDQAVLDEYKTLCDQLGKEKIVPLVILFESNAPEWFTQKNGFLAYENIPLFVRYAKKVFANLGTNQAYLIPFLNPNTAIMPWYQEGFSAMLNAFEHMLIAHRDTYTALKKMPGGTNTFIGISKNMNMVHAWDIYNPLSILKAKKINEACHTSFYNFINTGSMAIYFNEITKDDFSHSMQRSFDFIGISYEAPYYLYSDNTLSTPDKSKNHLYAEGLYGAIKAIMEEIAPKKPILVLENGTPSDPYKIDYVLHKARSEKCQIIGSINH